ncbi:hypothetical protein MMC26_001322 [Xylographa opegraphella]|nr:hypothetical protein [Xylographa opegraphella]
MNHRQLNPADVSSTPASPEDAITANELFDQHSNGSYDSPKQLLSRLLSVRSIISTTTSSARRQQEDADVPGLQIFRHIGVGTCATVFEHVGSGFVLKKQDTEALSVIPDYRTHIRIRDSFAKYPKLDIKLPRPMDFIAKTHTNWWQENKKLFPPAYATPGNIIVSEHILPLPKVIRDALVELYILINLIKDKEHIKALPANKDCLARVYLGKRRRQDRQRSSPFFSLRNFNLHIDQMEELGLEILAFTNIMADALAVLHWEAKIDAEDVEFVLGSRPVAVYNEAPSADELQEMDWGTGTIRKQNFQRRSVHMWVLDFNRCQPISMNEKGIKQAVRAFYLNDPYYPCPGSDNPNDEAVWQRFSAHYLAASKRILGDEDTKLPGMFVEMLVSEGARRAKEKEEAQERASGSVM